MAYHLQMGTYGNAVLVALSTPQAIGGESTSVIAVRDCAINEAGEVVYSYNVGHAGGGYEQTDESILIILKGYYGEYSDYIYTELPLPAADEADAGDDVPAGEDTGTEEIPA